MLWGDGGRFYWGERLERGTGGIMVVFAWPSSQERHLNPYIDLYSSLGWSSIICHVDFLTLFSPEKATSLACGILDKLLKEVKISPLPIVLTSFSGGSKGCFYKFIQLIEGKCEGQVSLNEYHLVRDCICGQIYDSSPVDFTSDQGTRFILHPTVIRMSQPPRVVSWMARAFTSGLEALFLSRFEAQRSQYWQALYSSVHIGPVLIFCSKDDELAPYQIVCNFVQCLQERGGDVKLVKWSSSPHVAHYKYHQSEYKAAVAEMLIKAATIYSHRRQLNGEITGGARDPVPESVGPLNGTSDHFYLPSSMEYNEPRDAGSVLDEQKSEPFHLPSFNADGVLGQMLFDVCVPKNIEGWDIKPVGSLNRRPGFTLGRRHGPFNPVKCTRRSKL